MLVKILKNNHPRSSLLFFATALFLFILKLLGTDLLIEHLITHPLFSFFNISSLNISLLRGLIIFGLTLIISIGFNNVVIDRAILKQNTILPAFCFIIVGSVFSSLTIWISSFILLFFFSKLFSIYKQERPYLLLFDSGFLLGLSSMFYPPVIYLFPIILIANLIYGLINWRNYLIPFIGLISAWIMFGAYFFMTNSVGEIKEYYSHVLILSSIQVDLSINGQIFLFVSAIVLACSLYELSQWIILKSLRSRKAFIIFLTYSLFCFIGCFTKFNQDHNHLLLFAFPFSVLAGNYFLYANRKWLAEFLLWLLLIVAIYFHLQNI